MGDRDVDGRVVTEEEAIVKAWTWATFMSDGSMPTQSSDAIALARIDGFAIGRLGRQGWGELKNQIPRYRFDQPYPDDFEPPERFTWANLLGELNP